MVVTSLSCPESVVDIDGRHLADLPMVVTHINPSGARSPRE